MAATNVFPLRMALGIHHGQDCPLFYHLSEAVLLALKDTVG